MHTYVAYLVVSLLMVSTAALGQNKPYMATTEAKEDITYLLATFEEVHYNPYFATSKEEIEALKKELFASWHSDSIPVKDFIASGMKLTARMSGGHSAMDWKNTAVIPGIKAHMYLPFTGKLASDGQAFVVTASGLSSIQAGDRVQAINGVDIIGLYKECMTYVGGIEGFKNAHCEDMFPLYMFYNDQIAAPYTITLSGGEAIETGGLNVNELLVFLNGRQATEPYHYEIVGGEVGVLTYNSCTDYEAFEHLLAEMFSELAVQKIDKLIIDIRENSGGDSGLNDILLSYLTKSPYRQSAGRYWKVSSQAKRAYAEVDAYTEMLGEDFMQRYMNTPDQEVIGMFDEVLTEPMEVEHAFDGTVCVLIGPGTFSSANFLADALKTYNIATLIGEATGEYTNDFGELISFTLPHTKHIVYISTTLDIGANGNPDILAPVYPDIQVEGDALSYAFEWLKSSAAGAK